MKNKLILAMAALLSASASIFAFTPVFGGEDLYVITSPELLGASGSVTGGPVSNVVPASIVLNPALTAREQLYAVNLSYLNLINAARSSESDSIYGAGFQLGAVIPTRYFVYAATVNGVFASFDRMDLGNSFNLHAGASKNINDHLDVGLNLYGGIYTGNSYGTDWTLGADLGALYTFDNIAFLKSPRLGISLMNLGKPLTHYAATNIKGTTEGTSYPGILTPKVGFASHFLETGDLTGAFSADLSFPTCMNVVADLGVGFNIKEIVGVDLSWECLDLQEYLNGAKLKWPTLGVNLKFKINTGAITKVNKSWEESNICPSVAVTNLYSGIVAACVGANLQLGQKDSTAPEIILWNDSSATGSEE